MDKFRAAEFDLRLVLNSGQLFNWREHGGSFYVAHSGHVIKVRHDAGMLRYRVFPVVGDEKRFVSDFLGLGGSPADELAEFASDECLMSSVSACRGLRLSRQEPWECLLAFLVSQNNNIKRIRSTLLRLSEKFGEKVVVDGKDFFLFPTLGALSSASIGGLRSCGLGYRAEYVKIAAQAVSDGFDLDGLRSMDYDSAKRRLMELDGVGEKVADCVLVFGFGFGEAFPVDRWMARVLQRHYAKRKMSEKKLADFARKKFGKKAAVVHEFLFANRENLCAARPKPAGD